MKTIKLNKTRKTNNKLNKNLIFFLLFLLISLIFIFTASLNKPLSNPKAESLRVTGGQVVEEGKYPFFVLISNDGGRCGGSLINKRWIITAAHCVMNEKDTAINDLDKFKFFFRVNNNSQISKKKFDASAVDIIINNYDSFKKIQFKSRFKFFEYIPFFYTLTIHPKPNDIALIKLDKEINLNPIRLMNSEISNSIENEEGTIIGYGNTTKPPLPTSIPNQLMEAKVIIKKIENDLLSPPIEDNIDELDSMFLMTYYEDRKSSAGIGDSGGALFINKNGSYHLVGIISTGDISTGTFTVYTNVNYYLNWIKSYVNVVGDKEYEYD